MQRVAQWMQTIINKMQLDITSIARKLCYQLTTSSAFTGLLHLFTSLLPTSNMIILGSYKPSTLALFLIKNIDRKKIDGTNELSRYPYRGYALKTDLDPHNPSQLTQLAQWLNQQHAAFGTPTILVIDNKLIQQSVHKPPSALAHNQLFEWVRWQLTKQKTYGFSYFTNQDNTLTIRWLDRAAIKQLTPLLQLMDVTNLLTNDILDKLNASTLKSPAPTTATQQTFEALATPTDWLIASSHLQAIKSVKTSSNHEPTLLEHQLSEQAFWQQQHIIRLNTDQLTQLQQYPNLLKLLYWWITYHYGSH